MKRWLVRICVFLLLGAIANIAVAWSLAVFAEPIARPWVGSPVGPGRDIPRMVQLAHNAHARNNGRLWDVESGYEAIGYRTYVLRTLGSGSGNHLQSTSLVVGWPLATLWSHYVYYTENGTDGARIFEEELTGILVGDKWVPIAPVWPGFAINTLFYAVILWGLFAMPFALRRRRRFKRGMCPKCAYDLRKRPNDSSACPECGTPVT